MNDTEKRALDWLKAQGYKDIIFQRRNSPDFMTGEGLGFEAKLSRNNVIWFGPNQLERLAQFQGEVTILVFLIDGSNPVAQIPFDEIRHYIRNWRNYRIEGWGDSGMVAPTEVIATEEEAKDMLLTLDDVADRLCISNAAARMLVLYEGAIPYKKVGPRGIRVEEADLQAYINKLDKEAPSGSKEEARIREPFTGSRVLQDGADKVAPPNTA